jgi:hypothetical protein
MPLFVTTGATDDYYSCADIQIVQAATTTTVRNRMILRV